MKKIILNILMIFSLFGCSPRIAKANGLSSYEDFDFPETTTNSTSSTNNDLEVDWSDFFDSTSSIESTSSTITSTTSSEDFPFGRDEIITSIDESNHTTESGYNDVISDLNNLEIDYSNYFNTTENTFITLNQTKENNQLRTFVYLDLPVYLGNSNYQIKLVTDFYTFDEENAYTYDLKLISKHNEIDVAKYEIQNLQNLDDYKMKYYVVSFGNKNSDPLVFEMENEIYVRKTFYYEMDYKTEVLKELSKDEDFDISNYPTINDDYSIDVVQIRENTAKELIVYVYQPSALTKELTASKIAISRTKDTKEYEIYDLEFIEREYTLAKYKVKDIELLTDVIRYYDISAIYRPFDETIDEEPNDDNVINHMAYPVGQYWTLISENGTTTYSMKYEEYIDITLEHNGFLRYETYNGFSGSSPKPNLNGVSSLTWVTQAVDSHYVCFNTDKQMDELLEARLYFKATATSDNYEWNHTPNVYNVNLNDDNPYIDVYDFNSFHIEGGWLHDDYDFGRILKATDFLISEDDVLDESDKEVINNIVSSSKNTAWVLRYYESDYQLHTSGDSSTGTSGLYSVEVTETTILRLKFITDGKVYNLGVIDNISSGDNIPDGDTKPDLIDKEYEDWKLWVEIILCLLALSALVAILNAFSPIFKLVLDVIKKCFKWVINGVVLVISIPFKILSSLFNKRE